MNETLPTTNQETEHPENRKIRLKLDGSETENPHILKLKKPLPVGDGERKITELKLDCAALEGSDFLRYAREFRMRFNSSIPNIIYDETFRATAIAAINEIPLEDLTQIAYSDMVKATSRILFFFVE
jgi:hypothetical protein